MSRPSKNEIRAAIEKLKDTKPSSSSIDKPQPIAKLEAAKTNKNRIRKKGVS